MRFRSALVVGVFLSLAACTVDAVSTPSGSEADPASTPSSPASSTPSSDPPANDDVTPESNDDAGSASADADASADAGKKPTIPPPTFGYLHAYTNTGESCQFSIDGVYESSGNVLDTPLSADAYVIGCKRQSGVSVEEAAVITAGKTTNVEFHFQIIPSPIDPAEADNGTLVAVAVGGSCAFTVDGSSIGSGATATKVLPEGTYTVACKPVAGATKSRSITITAGNTAMAMFKL